MAPHVFNDIKIRGVGEGYVAHTASDGTVLWLPPGTDGQVFTTHGASDPPTWEDSVSIPAGGTTGQVLTKQSASDFDADWETPAAGGSGTGSALTFTTDLRFWYKASNATLAGSRVTSLADDAASAGGVTLSQATANAQPGYTTRAYNNQPALAFSGAHHLAGASAPLTATNNYTIFAVVRPFVSLGNTTARIAMCNGGTADGYAITVNVSASVNEFLIGGLLPGVIWAPSDDYYHAGAPEIICMQRAAGTTSLYRNGKLLGNTYANAPNTPTLFKIGWDGANGKYIGEFFEGCGYNASLSSTDRGTVFADIGAAYDIPVE